MREFWRAWSAIALIAGTAVLPLFLEVFSGGAPTRFLAQPLRWAWAGLLVLPILRAGWLSPRLAALGVTAFTTLLSGIVLVDLAGLRFIHPGFLLALEWWQRGLYPWIEMLPRWYLLGRPGYLWIVAIWTFVEGAVVGHLLFWRVGRTPSSEPSTP